MALKYKSIRGYFSSVRMALDARVSQDAFIMYAYDSRGFRYSVSPMHVRDKNSNYSVDQNSDDSVSVKINDSHWIRSNSDADSESGSDETYDQKKKPDGDGENAVLLGEGVKFRNKPKKEHPCLGCPEGICRFIGKHCYSFFTGPSDSYTPIKTALGFPFGFLLAYGPVQNIMDNGKEITRTLSCAAELSANHTRAKWELKMKPLEDAMKQWQVNMSLFM
ncbi:unnamed protein product [Mytilus coruscus]|uniref:Uncharacterized protein n=1 Tax=Mytilus coruscus TaxID=42192 RepID=A0A6J8ABD6_MYTCO|nr:unnamed protein product [Mytilus coruscus]